MNNIEKKHATIFLPYFKQGDDLNSCIEKYEDGNVNTKETLKKYVELLENVINIIKEIDSIIPENNDIEIDGDTHYIGITGDKKILDKLVEKDLAQYEEEYDDDDDDDVENCEENEESSSDEN